MAKVKGIEIEISSGYTVTLTPEEAMSLRDSLNAMFKAAVDPVAVFEGPAIDCGESESQPEESYSRFTATRDGNWMVISSGEDFEVKKG